MEAENMQSLQNALPMYAPDLAPEQTISDLIGEDYQTWEHGRVLIDAGCGTGKTHFVLKDLMPWATNWKKGVKFQYEHSVLYLCNRVSLQEVILMANLTEMQKKEVELGLTAPKEFFAGSCFQIKTYQAIEYFWRQSPEKVREWLARFKYIIADECHYFLCDAPFNENTDISKNLLDELVTEKVVIYMSATADLLFNEYIKDETNLIKRYQMNKFYSISELYSYARNIERNEILDTLPEGEKALVFVKSRKDLEAAKERYADAAGYYCSENNPGGPMDELDACIKEGILQKKILFCTTALYNGIDIKDPALKHILVELWDPTDIAQAIGRKRPVDQNDTFKLYLRYKTADELQSICGAIVKKIEPAILYRNRNDSEDAKAKWIAFASDPKAREQIEYILTEKRDESSGIFTYEVKQTRLKKLVVQQKILRQMLEDGYFETLLHGIVSINQSVHIQTYCLRDLWEFITENIGKEYPSDELKKLLVETGHITVRDRSQDRGIGWSKIKKAIEPYKVYIEIYRKWNKANRGKKFARIVLLK